jgi:hypothetical protein
MGSALEASSQRIRYHLRRPIPGRGEVLTRNARNTVKEIVPPPARNTGVYQGSWTCCLLARGWGYVPEETEVFTAVQG